MELRNDPIRCHVWMDNAFGDAAGTRVHVEDGFAVYDRGSGLQSKASSYSSPTRIAFDNGVRTVEYATLDENGLKFDHWHNDEHIAFAGGATQAPPGRVDIPAFYYSASCSVHNAALGVAELMRAMMQP